MKRLGRLGPKRVASVVVLVAVAAVVLFLVLPRIWGDDTRLVSRTDGSSSGAGSAPGTRQYYSVYVGQVCVSGVGTARIRSIEPVDPRGGLTVTDFAVVAAGEDTLGGIVGRLRDEPAYQGSKSVSDLCDGAAAPDLIIEVFKPRAEDAWAHEYRIDYDLKDNSHSEAVRFGFGVCEEDLDHCNASENW